MAPTGQARTPDEAKTINKNTNAFNTVQNSVRKIIGTKVLGTDNYQGGAMTLGHSIAGKDHNTIENETKAINAAVASMEDNGIKISNRNAELVQRFSDLNSLTRV